MRNFKKIIACGLAFFLFVYLAVFDYAKTKEDLAPKNRQLASAELDEAQEKSDPENNGEDDTAEAATLQEKIAALAAEFQPIQLALDFLGVEYTIYGDEDVSSVLDESGDTATVIFSGELPVGDYRKIEISEVQRIIDSVWGCSATGEWDSSDLEAWQSKLGDYLSRINWQTGITPEIYIFMPGTYPMELDSEWTNSEIVILVSLGVTELSDSTNGE